MSHSSEPTDDGVELRAERPFACRTDPVRTGLFELLDLLLQLPGPLPVRLQLGAGLLPALDPLALRGRDHLLGLGEPIPRGGQLGLVLLEVPRRLLQLLQPPGRGLELLRERPLGLLEPAAAFGQAGELGKLGALLRDRRQLGERLAERRELRLRLGDPLQLGLGPGPVPFRDVALASGDVEPVLISAPAPERAAWPPSGGGDRHDGPRPHAPPPRPPGARRGPPCDVAPRPSAPPRGRPGPEAPRAAPRSRSAARSAAPARAPAPRGAARTRGPAPGSAPAERRPSAPGTGAPSARCSRC